MGLFSKKIKFPSRSDVDKAEEAKRRAELRRAEKEAYRESFAKARIARASREGSQAGSRRWYDAFQNMGGMSSPAPRTRARTHRKHGKRKNYTIVGGKAYPIGVSYKKGKKKKKRGSGGYFDVGGGFDISDNWGFL